MAFNLGGGLSAMGQTVSAGIGAQMLEQQKADLEAQRIELDNSLAEERESRGRQEESGLINQREQATWERSGGPEEAATKKLALKEAVQRHNALYGDDADVTPSGTQAAPTAATTSSPASAAGDQSTSKPIPPGGKGAPAVQGGLPPGWTPEMKRQSIMIDGGKAYMSAIESFSKPIQQRSGEDTGYYDFSSGQKVSLGKNDDPNKEFHSDGTPNLAYQARENDKIRLQQEPERDRLSQENYAPPTMIGYTGPDGEEIQKAAVYNKKTAKYYDVATLQPIEAPKNLRVIGNSTGGARSQAAVSRILTNAEDATSGIENLARIGSGASGGLFRNLETTPLSALGRSVTPQDVQDTQATIAGLSRAMGGLATGGLAVDDNVMKSYEGLNLNLGDTYITKMRKLAEMRQQTTNALDVQSVSPVLSNDQRKKAAALSDRIKVAIPWTVSDVQDLENARNPRASLRDLSMQKLGKAPAPKSQAAPQAAPGKIIDFNDLPSGQ